MSVRANIPFKLDALTTAYLTVETAIEKPESMRTICDDGHPPAGIKQTRSCTTCKGEGPFKSGREVGGVLVPLGQAELDQIKAEVEAGKKEAILTAHPADEVATTTLPGESTYFLTPGKNTGWDVYCAFRRLVQLAEEQGKVILTELGLKGPAQLWRLGLFHNVVTLTAVAWPEAVKAVPTVTDVPVDAFEGALLDKLAGMSRPFDASQYRNTAEQLRANLVAAAAGAAPPVQGVPAQVPTNVAFFDSLRRSAGATKTAATKKATAAKKTAAKKTAARKTAARKKGAA